MKNTEIITFIIIILVGIFLMVWLIEGIITKNKCKNICEEKRAIHYERVPDGGWFSLKDKCICFYEDRIEAFRLK